MDWIKKIFSRTPKPKEYIDYDVGYLEASIEFDNGEKYTTNFKGNVSIECDWGVHYNTLFHRNNTAFEKFNMWKENLPQFINTDDGYLPTSSIKRIKITKQESKIETVEAL